ncbi:hypothetical protein OBP_233 [Pseudomonas phage OBP]|uniref:hypothetical protein n=1 Tax=Pseudomonas phage OBP TaxID=1124849 RepID=UPI000240D5CD|nr:hypothetical protein OBP_233 [Pseudomonas phage OBP]AEV89670.1 hypothetical protein OBP_233 [Pseudomonas phage OBP]
METLKELGKLLDEMLTRLSALILTVALAGTLFWPIGPEEWWDRFLKYVYMGVGGVAIYLVAPIIYYFFKAAYYDWKLKRL